jgi:hypothetical protein
MKEVKGNLWTYPADVRVITTNGTIKKNGECVMGQGCALEANKKWGIAGLLGKALKAFGNVPINLSSLYNANRQWKEAFALWTFPVKHNWFEKADLTLIKASAVLLSQDIDEDYPNDEGNVILIPRPGCGNGGLLWEDVKPVLEPILDDRFHVITF